MFLFKCYKPVAVSAKCGFPFFHDYCMVLKNKEGIKWGLALHMLKRECTF